MYLLIAGTLAMAQISTGEPSAVKVKTGNRPDKGTFGVYFGGGLEMGSFLNPAGAPDRYMLPLVNVKYFFTDRFEGRLGLDVYRYHLGIKGDKLDDGGNTHPNKNKGSAGNIWLWPGIAYHFTNKNIFDVYCGAELPFGLSTGSEYASGEGKAYTKSSTSTFNVGLGAFLGIQAFIGNLPLSIGLEYGLYGAYGFGNKTKNISVNDAGEKTVYYTSDYADAAGKWDKLHINEGYMGNQIRLTLSYYFK